MKKRRSMIAAAVLSVILLCLCGCKGTEPKREPSVQSVTIGETTMEYLHFGNKDGEAFVILPGLSLKSVMGSADGIKARYALLAETYDVYLFDHIAREPEGYTIDDMARDTLAAFDAAGLKCVHLMGVSMGGMVAQTIAANAPERVSSLILCSTAMSGAYRSTDAFEAWERYAAERNTPALAEAFGAYVYTPSFFEQYRDAIIAACEGATELDFRNFAISAAAIRGFDVSDRIGTVACPAFVLGAGEDRVLGVQASYDLIDALHCDGYIYEGYGHGAYDEAPDYVERIAAFLKGE